MPGREEHSVVIERRGAAHQALCACGWSGHSWNELRPAEADAWHHAFGEDRLVDARSPSDWERLGSLVSEPSVPIETVITAARSLARSSAPNRPSALDELSRVAGESGEVLMQAQEQIGELLRRHARQSASTADEEWLELHTARRLIEAAQSRLDH